jgi:hypothetical protein
MAVSLSLFILPLAPQIVTSRNVYKKEHSQPAFIPLSPPLRLNRKTLRKRYYFAGGFQNRSAPPLVFACPSSLSSTSLLFSLLGPFFASSLSLKALSDVQTSLHVFRSRDLNGLPPVTQPKFTLCLMPFS